MILVFVGAGGAAAVDPEQYPTTVEFFNRLPDDITEDPLFVKIHEFLKIKKGGQPIDIEEVLWNLDELRDYFQTSRNTEAIAGWIMTEHRINQLIENTRDLSNLLNGMSNLESQIQNLKDEINAQVYNFYATPPNPEKLSDWVQLLKGLAGADSTIEIFTTNYDLILETAIKEAKIKVKTGRAFDDIQTKLDTALWESPKQSLDFDGRLTKLHGSVDWQLRNEEIIMSPVFTGDHQKHLVLYPGYKGVPRQEPFDKFHEYLQRVVGEANAAIFIGFAFRDEYINTILSDLPQEIPKFAINKDSTLPDLTFLKECTHHKDGITKESVEACIQSLHLLGAQKDFRMGIFQYQSKKYTDAITRYDKAIQSGLQNADVYSARGDARYALKDYQNAIVDYDKAIEIKSQHAPIYINRGNAKYNLQNYQSAIVDYDKAIELDPQYALAYYNHGNTKRALGDNEGAIVDYDKATELDPQYAPAYYTRGNTKRALGDNEGAIVDYDKATELDPQYALAYYTRGNTKRALGDNEGAIVDYDKATELDPQYAPAYYSRGSAKSDLGDEEGANEDFAKAFEIDPSLKKD